MGRRVLTLHGAANRCSGSAIASLSSMAERMRSEIVKRRRAAVGTTPKVRQFVWRSVEPADGALADLEQGMLATVYGHSREGILVVDQRNRLVSCNPRLVAMWGTPTNGRWATHDGNYLRWFADQVANPREFLDGLEQANADRASSAPVTMSLKDGRVFERYSVPVLAGARVCGRVWYFRDETERHHACAVGV